MVKIEKVNYKTFGNCVKISNDICELYVTVDFGPRIIRYSLLGKENMMKEDSEFASFHCGKDFDDLFGKGSTWYIRGGHRLWFSPEQKPATYYPDNFPVKYENIENGIRFMCDRQIGTRLKYAIEVVLDEKTSDVEVNHYITNENVFDVEIAAWALSVTDAGGLCAIPVPQTDTGVLPNRNMAFWPYTDMKDKRANLGNKYITVKQDSSVKNPWKIGLSNEDGFAMVFNHDCLFVKRYPYDEMAEYPDGGMNCEVYTNSVMLECESLSPLYVIAPNETIIHTENWSLYGNVEAPDLCDEEKIEELAQKYV